MMLNIVLFGPPGAGKGTQSENIVKKFGIIHLSTGNIFRANIRQKTTLGKLAESYLNSGRLVPDEVTINMLKDEVNKFDQPKGFIFDGFPRTTAQAKALDKFLQSKDESITAMIALEVPEDELKERLRKRALESGRTDDADPKIIDNRIAVYKNETAQVKDYYENQDKYYTINGKGTIDEITESIVQTIEALSY